MRFDQKERTAQEKIRLNSFFFPVWRKETWIIYTGKHVSPMQFLLIEFNALSFARRSANMTRIAFSSLSSDPIRNKNVAFLIHFVFLACISSTFTITCTASCNNDSPLYLRLYLPDLQKRDLVFGSKNATRERDNAFYLLEPISPEKNCESDNVWSHKFEKNITWSCMGQYEVTWNHMGTKQAWIVSFVPPRFSFSSREKVFKMIFDILFLFSPFHHILPFT